MIGDLQNPQRQTKHLSFQRLEGKYGDWSPIPIHHEKINRRGVVFKGINVAYIPLIKMKETLAG